nr:uncharacterized protein LOC117688060 [Crassostrea gigas]
MNQAQALSSVNYRILRTISLDHHFYIIDIAYSDKGTVCLSVCADQKYGSTVITKRNPVGFVLPTGSYIDYGHWKFYYINDNIVNACSCTDSYLSINGPKVVQNKADVNLFQTHGIAVCKSDYILVCQWNRKFKDQSAGKVVKLEYIADNRNDIVLEIESDKNQPLYICPTNIAENGNGDICVFDVRAVVVTDAGGMLRFRYQGNLRDFDPYGICCDSSCNIIVADMKNDKIHVIDKDGAFHVTYDGIKMPRAICIDENNNLYVGEWHTDTVKVIAR